MIFIGIDIAKNSHFASAVNSDGEVLVKPFSFENSKDGFNIFLNKFKDYPIAECFVGLESTGHYGDNLINYLFPKGFRIGMINAIQTNSLRNSNIRKTKNDKINTFLISKCIQLGNYSLVKEIDINKINKFIDEITCMSKVRKEFYKNIIYCRYQILKETYNKLKNTKEE